MQKGFGSTSHLHKVIQRQINLRNNIDLIPKVECNFSAQIYSINKAIVSNALIKQFNETCKLTQSFENNVKLSIRNPAEKFENALQNQFVKLTKSVNLIRYKVPKPNLILKNKQLELYNDARIQSFGLINSTILHQIEQKLKHINYATSFKNLFMQCNLLPNEVFRRTETVNSLRHQFATVGIFEKIFFRQIMVNQQIFFMKIPQINLLEEFQKSFLSLNLAIQREIKLMRLISMQPLFELNTRWRDLLSKAFDTNIIFKQLLLSVSPEYFLSILEYKLEQLKKCINPNSWSKLIIYVNDLKKTINVNSNLPAVIMCASIIETILLEIVKRNAKKILSTDQNPKRKNKDDQINKLNLNQLANVANKNGLLNSTSLESCTYIRNFRNVVHPAKLVGSEYYPSRKNLIVCLLETISIIECLSEKIQNNFSEMYRADQS